ncbi:hypothetical protein [Flammeovirga kamogawensis]|uniref:Outer membrane protein beta-barrel domain-containing protein n=1 Tax=Flammeovirga kamogawensis TaxID=373891 RepID=A0ABX8GR92_9BACT|nr:hypothetical protein [Flammeovirga kamogawensis]MBB6463226.1 hypothetical protein [Flammeovirga kamogawensis]QWG05924.1 hypothetical protein KM029_11145 [Flammeovirga kamogawensis]TRX67749.1 hypothetical protein EO216_06155 [Flammeovirga kamogawensis]
MKNITSTFILLLSFFISQTVTAQVYNYVEDSTKTQQSTQQEQYKRPTNQEVDAFKDQKHSDKPLKDKIFFGGGLGFGFSSYYTQIVVQPMAGYMITPNFQVGLGLVYEYFERKDVDYKENNYGIRPFARYMIEVRDGLRVFPQAEYYGFSNNYEYRDNISGEKVSGSQWRDQFLIGGGISQGIGRKGGVNFIALYDVSYDEQSSYYSSPWVFRIEVAF